MSGLLGWQFGETITQGKGLGTRVVPLLLRISNGFLGIAREDDAALFGLGSGLPTAFRMSKSAGNPYHDRHLANVNDSQNPGSSISKKSNSGRPSVDLEETKFLNFIIGMNLNDIERSLELPGKIDPHRKRYF